MKHPYRLTLGIFFCLLAAAGAYFWALGLMDSLYAYRSPLKDSPPAPGQPLGEPSTRRVVFVLIDALRADTSLNTEVMPFLSEMRTQGAWATMHSRPPSYSEPGYTVLLTGAWPDTSDGPALNLDYEDIPTWTQDNLFSAAQRAGLKTAISGFYWFEKLVPQNAVSRSFYTSGEDQLADREVVDAALPWLHTGDIQFVLIHIDQVDYAGHHEGGPIDPRWDAAATRADDLLREIATALDLTQDTLFIGSDHGQIERGGHGGQDPVVLSEPFVLVGAGVRPGRYNEVEMVDVAPTLAALLGTNIPASSQGQARTEMLTLSPEQETELQSALEDQQRQLLRAYQTAIGKSAPLEPGADIVSAYQKSLETARRAHLNAERWPRGTLALGLFLLPAVYLSRSWNPARAWLFGGAALYMLLFNLAYAILDQRTYSLSSVYSADDLISYCATTAALALTLAWLIVSLKLKSFHRGGLRAAELSLGFTLLSLYLLSIPVLVNFVINGMIITWTLPEFTSMFLGFISLIQILLVAALGVVLTSISALIARFVTPITE